MPVPPTQRGSAPAPVSAPTAPLVIKPTSQTMRPSYASCAKKAVDREKTVPPKTTISTLVTDEHGKGANTTHSGVVILASVPEGRMSSFVSAFSATKLISPSSPGSDTYSDEESIEIITTRTPREVPILRTRLPTPLCISPPDNLISEPHLASDQVLQTASTPSLSADSSPAMTLLPLNKEPVTSSLLAPLKCQPHAQVPDRGVHTISEPRQLSMSCAEVVVRPHLPSNATRTLNSVATPERPSLTDSSGQHHIKTMTFDLLSRTNHEVGFRTRSRWSVEESHGSNEEVMSVPPLPPTPFASLDDPPTTNYDMYSDVDGSQPWSLDGVFVNDDPQRGLAVDPCQSGTNSSDGKVLTESYQGESPMFFTQYAVHPTTEQILQFAPHGMTRALADGIAVQLQLTAAGFPATAYYIPPPPLISQLTTATDATTSAKTHPTESLIYVSGAATGSQTQTQQMQLSSAVVPPFGVAQSVQAAATASLGSEIIPLPSHAIELAIAHAVGSMPPVIHTPNRNKFSNSNRPHRISRYSTGFNRSAYSTPNKHYASADTSRDHSSDRPDNRNPRNPYASTSSRRLGSGVPTVQVDHCGNFSSVTSTNRHASIDSNGGLGGGCRLGAVHSISREAQEQSFDTASSSTSSDGLFDNTANGNGTASLDEQRLGGALDGGVSVEQEPGALPSGHRRGATGYMRSRYGHGGYTGRGGLVDRSGVTRAGKGDDGSFT